MGLNSSASAGQRKSKNTRKGAEKLFGFTHLFREARAADVHKSIIEWMKGKGCTIVRDTQTEIEAVHWDPWSRKVSAWTSEKIITIRLTKEGDGVRARAIAESAYRRIGRDSRRDYDEWVVFSILMEDMWSHVDRHHRPSRELVEVAEERRKENIEGGGAIMKFSALTMPVAALLLYLIFEYWPPDRSGQGTLAAVICFMVLMFAPMLVYLGWSYYASGKRIERYCSLNPDVRCAAMSDSSKLR